MRKLLPSFREHDPDWIGEIKDFLSDPWSYLNSFSYQHSVFFFLVNPQFVFFGQPSYLLSPSSRRAGDLVNTWIMEIERDFDLILILEELDVSLALLVLKFCWEVQDVVHLKLNTMKREENQLEESDFDNLRKFNWADDRLYKYFKGKLQVEIAKYGHDVVEKIKNEIISESNRLSNECLDSSY